MQILLFWKIPFGGCQKDRSFGKAWYGPSTVSTYCKEHMLRTEGCKAHATWPMRVSVVNKRYLWRMSCHLSDHRQNKCIQNSENTTCRSLVQYCVNIKDVWSKSIGCLHVSSRFTGSSVTSRVNILFTGEQRKETF